MTEAIKDLRAACLLLMCEIIAERNGGKLPDDLWSPFQIRLRFYSGKWATE